MIGDGDGVVIAGAGLGGLRTAEQLRTRGYEGWIRIVGDELHLPYNRPPLSKDALRGRVDHAQLAFRSKVLAGGVEWLLGRTVAHADLRARTVTLDDGEELAYDALVAATGVRARRLPLTGAPDRRHVVRTLDDAARLGAILQRGERVLVVGAGFIGCEVAATAAQLGCQVDVVDRGSTPMQRPVGPLIGRELQRRFVERSVRFHLNRIVTAMSEVDDAVCVQLDDGAVLQGAVVVEAVGSLPNVDWLRSNDLDLTDGVLTDDELRPVTRGAVVDDVRVVGDIARFPNELFDAVPRRVEHWNMPTETARRAAQTLWPLPAVAGPGDSELLPAAPFRPVPAFWSDQFDMRIQSFGIPGLGADDVRVLEGRLEGDVVVGYFDDDVIVGVVLIGFRHRYPFYRRLIVDRHPAAVAAGCLN